MFCEIDHVAVDGRLWERVKAGDKEAAEELRSKLDGVVLYMHALSTRPTDVCVTLRELEEQHIVCSVCLNTRTI